MEQPKIDLNPQQIQIAANAGVALLNTPGAVKVDGPMAVSGVVKTLAQLLLAIANQEVMVINIPPKLEDAPPPAEPNKEVADAVAPAVESSGNSSDAPAAEVTEK